MMLTGNSMYIPKGLGLQDNITHLTYWMIRTIIPVYHKNKNIKEKKK